MAISTIPLLTGSDAYTQQVDFDGKVYEMALRYNARETHWYLTLSRENVILISNIKVVHGTDLLLQFKFKQEMPQGELSIRDLAGKYADPDADTFGDTVIMQYADAV